MFLAVYLLTSKHRESIMPKEPLKAEEMTLKLKDYK